MKKMKSKIGWSNVVAFIMMILTIAVGSLVISWMLQDTEHSRNIEARCKSLGGEWATQNVIKTGRKSNKCKC